MLSGFLWLQGEADAKDAADASNYERNLLRLVTSLRHDTGALELPIIFVGFESGVDVHTGLILKDKAPKDSPCRRAYDGLTLG